MRVAGAIVAIVVAVPAAAALVFYVYANGITAGGLALATVPLLVALGVVGPRRSRRVAIACAALLAVDVLYAGARLLATRGGGGVRYCDAGGCDARAPLLSRLAPEDETARAGLALARTLGGVTRGEAVEAPRLLEAMYEGLTDAPRFRGLPNALLITGGSSELRYLRWVPPGARRRPCLIFLHGFGGQMTSYLRALLDGPLGDEVVVLAPFYDRQGAFWERDAARLVTALLDRALPAEADPDRVFLVGLSNGGVGASALAERPELRRRLRGVVLLVGAGAVAATGPRPPDTLMIAGASDPRFSLAAMQSRAARLRARGARVEVEVLAGDHLILFSRTRAVTAALRTWLRRWYD